MIKPTTNLQERCRASREPGAERPRPRPGPRGRLHQPRTENALKARLFAVKDAIAVIDDYLLSPRGSSSNFLTVMFSAAARALSFATVYTLRETRSRRCTIGTTSMMPAEPSRELVPLPEAVSLAAAPQRPIARALIGRVLGATVGISTIITSAFGMLGAVIGSAHKPIRTSVGLAVFFAAFGLAGSFLTRRMFRLRPVEGGLASSPRKGSRALPLVIRQRMVVVASRHQGRVTAAELAAALGVEEGAAAQALEAAAQSGEARMLFSPEGIAVFEFSGLVANKAEAREPWQL